VAILIPDVPKACSLSERLVFERLGRELPDEWVVLHSLGLPGHETKIWGEADIVVISALGVFALEVKGGQVSCQDGVWRFGGSDIGGYTKKEDPWTQAKGTMMAIRERLHAEGYEFREMLLGYGVVMPMTRFTTTGAEIVPEVLLDDRSFRQKLNLYISHLQHYWHAECLAKHGRAYGGLTGEQIRRVRQILRPDLETALSLGGYLTGIENRLLQLTNEQVRTSRRMAANPRTIVRGAAGTGKSLIAIERAKSLAEGGARTLYLCFNQLLASHVRGSLQGDPRAANLEVRHVHSIYREIIEKGGLLAKLQAEDPDDPDFFPKRFPDLVYESICETPIEGWDALVIDEAQDLLTPEHLDALDLMVRDGLDRGRWHLFLDPMQNLYGSDVQAQVEGRLAQAHPSFDDLSENCRNTRQVALQASIVSGIDLAVFGAPDGLPCDNIYYASEPEGMQKLEDLLGDLLQKGVRPQDIAILSTRRRENSLLHSTTRLCGRPLVDPSDAAGVKGGGLLFSTMHAFKGLERMVVLALDMGEIGSATWSMLHYAGLSRACGLLHCLVPAAARKAYNGQAEAFGRRIQTRPM
jgi:hypothetical protein